MIPNRVSENVLKSNLRLIETPDISSSVEKQESKLFSPSIALKGVSMPSLNRQQLLEMACGNWVMHCIHAAVELKIPQQLIEFKGGSKIAEDLKLNEPALSRLLKVFCKLGLVIRKEDTDLYMLTESGRMLLPDNSNSICSYIKLNAIVYEGMWAGLSNSIRTGNSSFPQIYGADFFDFLSKNSETSELYNSAMAQKYNENNKKISDTYNFSNIRKIVDVGGGSGELLATILSNHSHLQGVLFDRPEVVIAPSHLFDGIIEKESRFIISSGNFFESVPSADLYILKSILHNWEDNEALIILKNCRSTMPLNSKILIVERVLSSEQSSLYANLMDIHMMLLHGGKERTTEEYELLLKQAGLKLIKTTFVGSDMKMIEAQPILIQSKL